MKLAVQLYSLRHDYTNGEEFLEPIQDEETFNEVSAVFVERLSEEYDIED